MQRVVSYRKSIEPSQKRRSAEPQWHPAGFYDIIFNNHVHFKADECGSPHVRTEDVDTLRDRKEDIGTKSSLGR